MSDASGAEPAPGPGATETDAQGGAGRLIASVVNNRVAAILLMVLVLGGGVFATTGLDRQLLPNVDLKQVVVTVPYPGANLDEVDASITQRVEARVHGIAGVSRVTARSAANSSSVVVDVEPLGSTTQVLEDVRAAVDRIESFPPPDAEQPQVMAGALIVPTLTLAVTSESLSAEGLRLAAEDLLEALLMQPSVASAGIEWAAERQITIELSEEALREHDLTINDVVGKVRDASADLTSGELHTEAGSLLLRVDEQRHRGEEFEDILLMAKPSGAMLRLRDVATVRDAFGDIRPVSELDGLPALFLSVRPKGDVSEIDLAAEARAFLAGYEAPAGASVSIWDDGSADLSARINALVNTGLLSLALVFIVLALTFDFRMAFWIALALPTAFLGAMLLFPAFGLTINLATLFALILAIGIVVGDAVVVGENIARQRDVLDRPAAAIEGARQVFWPLVVAVGTTMLGVLPLLFLDGLAGQLLNVAPALLLVLAVSLIHAFLILPSHLAHGHNWSRWPMSAIQRQLRVGIDDFRDRTAVPAIGTAVRHPVWSLAIGLAIVVLSALAVSTGVVRLGGLGEFEVNTVEADITFPVGTPPAVTEAGARQLARAAAETNRALPDEPIESIALVVGHRFPPLMNFTSDQDSYRSNVAAVRLQLKAESSRSVSAAAVEAGWRSRIGEVAGAERVAFGTKLRGAIDDFRIALSHPDADTLRNAVQDLRAQVQEVPGTLAVRDSLSSGKRHFDLEITDVGEAAGLTPRLLAGALRNRFFGAEAQRIVRGRDEVSVMVRYPAERRADLAELANERIPLSGGAGIPLTVAANVVEVQEFDAVVRIDGVRSAEVGGQVDPNTTTATTVMAQLEQGGIAQILARYPGLSYAATGPTADVAGNFESLGFTVPLALLAMYMVLAVLLRSYGQPLIVLTAMPLAAAGAVLAHLLLGYAMNLASLLGIVAVLGLAINDTVLLMDRYSSIRAGSDIPAVAAVSGAVRQRFRPILMTTITTVVALLPVLYIDSEAMQGTLVPFAVSVLGGLVASCAAVLFLVPAVMLVAEEIAERRGVEPAPAPGGAA